MLGFQLILTGFPLELHGVHRLSALRNGSVNDRVSLDNCFSVFGIETNALPHLLQKIVWCLASYAVIHHAARKAIPFVLV